VPGESATPEIQLSPQGEADRAWLRDRLGDRFRELGRDEDGDYCIELVRVDGRRAWCYGRAPDTALARARAKVESAAENRRIS
jgi:hypothetical protein